MAPTFETSGSMLAGTAAHRLVSIETTLIVQSGADRVTVQGIVEQAERMCFVLEAIEQPHSVERVTILNGVRMGT